MLPIVSTPLVHPKIAQHSNYTRNQPWYQVAPDQQTYRALLLLTYVLQIFFSFGIEFSHSFYNFLPQTSKPNESL